MQPDLKKARGAAAVAALLIAVCWSASALEIQVLSEANEEAPGSFATIVFAVINDSPTAETYALSFDAPAEWGILGAPSSIAVGAGEQQTLFLTVTIPSGALPGEYDVALTARSASNPANAATAVASITITQIHEIELAPPTGASVAPGEHVEYEFIAINRGNSQDSLALAAASSTRLPLALSAAAVHLAPQERIAVRVRLDVPLGASPGSDVLTLTAASTLYDEVEVNAVVFTTVLPPGPETVGRTLMEILPARIRLSLDKDVLGGAFSSRLTFSASGQIEGGYFSSNVGLSNPLGSDRPELGSFSILYRRSPTAYTIGDVSQRLSDFLQLACRGGSITVEEELFDLSIIAGGSDDETRFAGRFSLGPDEVNLGIGYLGVRGTEPTFRSIWSGSAAAEPLEDWSVRIEGALGIDGSLSSRAFLFGTAIDTAGLFFSGTAFSVGTHFPGSRADSAGIEISHRLRMTSLSLSASLSHVWDNVIGDPLVATTIRDDLGLNLTTTPLKDGPTLSSTVEFTWDRYPDLNERSEIDTLFAASVAETDGVFPYGISGKVTDRIDHVLGTHVRRSTFREGAGLSVDSFYLYLELTQQKQVDLTTDVVLSSTSDATIRFRPEGPLHEASIAFGNARDAFDLSTSLYIRFVEGLDLVFDGSISWDRGDSSSIFFGWGITLNASIDIPIPFFVTKGQIEGRTFIDRDGDGAYGPGDEPLRGIIVVADRREVSSNAEGLFRFTPAAPGAYAVTVRQLPPHAMVGGPTEVEVGAGETVWVDVPLRPVVVVTGRLFDDANRDGAADAGEGGFPEVRVLLREEATGAIADARTDATGGFIFLGVPPSRYTIAIDVQTLPERFVFTTSEEAALEITAEAPPPVALGGYVRPQEVLVTIQPPTADFTYAPDPPVAGGLIQFDGTPSFDFDGEIAAYAWDFDADGEVDAVSATPNHTFADAGVYSVSLTVTDDTGNTDTVTVSIEVRARPGATRPPGTPTFQPPIADFSFAPATPIAGETVRFDGSLSSDFDGQIVLFAWDFDADGRRDAVGPIAEHVFPRPGSFLVSLTVTDDSGNIDTMETSIDIGGEPDEEQAREPETGPPVASFQRSPAEPTAGELVLFNGTSSLDPGGQIVGFAWDFDGDGQPDSIAPLVEHVFAVAGQYAVSLTVTDNDGNTDTVSAVVSVVARAVSETGEPPSFQPPIADFAYMPAAPSSGDPVLFNGTFSSDFDGRVVAYAWDFDADGTIDSGDPVAEHVFHAPGVYPVSLTVTDNGGNTDTVVLSIDVK